MNSSPLILILAGPNGAGKSTSARTLVQNKQNFVNADDIARDLPADDRAHADIRAGRLALSMLDRMSDERRDFALETTLASRTLAPRIRALKANGYQFQMIFFCLPSPELAIQRVGSRVRMGGHDIPEATIRRRFVIGLENFLERYRPIADIWRVYANWDLQAPVLVAEGQLSNTIHVYNRSIWEQMLAGYDQEAAEDALSKPLGDSVWVTGEITRAVRQALAEHKSQGNAVVVWENGGARIASSEEIEIG